jgi:hypothetical protein
MNQLILLFIGIASVLTGVFLFVYHFAVANRISNAGSIDTSESLDFERSLSPTAELKRPISSPPIVSSPYHALHSEGTANTQPAQTAATLSSVPNLPSSQNYGYIPRPAPLHASPSQHSPDDMVAALENLIHARLSGSIDLQTYDLRKEDLLKNSRHVHTTDQATPTISSAQPPQEYISLEELVIDYSEGIISSERYEAEKARIQSVTR